jgi:RHS repeat-associated protein
VALALVAAVSLASAAAPTPREQRDGPDPNTGAALEAARQAQRDEDGRRADRDSAAGREERARSRTAYRDQDREHAIETGRRQFPEALAAPALEWPPLRGREAITRYRGSHEALVREPNGHHAILDSTVPLVGHTPDGDTAPVDLDLVDRGGTLEPRSAPVRMRIPENAAGHVTLGADALRVRLDGAAASAATVKDGKAFYPNVLPDTDFVVQPTPVGGELSLVLRSPASPSRPALRLDLSPSEHLRMARDGSPAAEVVTSDGRVAEVSPPAAYDAQGAPVDVRYAVAGDRLELIVDHASDHAYPVYVDPTFGIYDGNGTSPCPTGGTNSDGTRCDGWYWPGWGVVSFSSTSPCNAMPTPAPAFTYCQGPNGGLASGGQLYLYAKSGAWSYGAGDFVEWFRNPRSGAYIYRLDLVNATSVTNNSDVLAGINCGGACNNGWEAGAWRDFSGSPPTGTPAYRIRPSEANNTQYLCASAAAASNYVNWGTSDCLPPTSAHDDNVVVYGLRMRGPTAASPRAYAALGGAATYTSDRYAPTFTVAHNPSLPTAWVHSYTDTLSAHADDKGLGMGNVTLAGPQTSVIKSPPGCTYSDTPAATIPGIQMSDSYDSCPAKGAAPNNGWDMPATTYSPPEGDDTYTSTATDIVGNRDVAQDKTWNVKVDRTAPVFNPAPSGTLTTSSGWSRDTAPSVSTTLRDDGPGGVATSGAQKDTIAIDGTNVSTVTNKKADGTTTCDSSSGCAQTLPHNFTWSGRTDGSHTVTVSGQDALGDDPNYSAGHRVSRSWTFRSDTTQPNVTLSGDGYAPNGWVPEGQRTVHFDATDNLAGVKKVQLMAGTAVLDEKTPNNCTNPCPPTFSGDLHWTPTTEGTQNVKVHVIDAADATNSVGNERFTNPWDVKVDTAAPTFGTPAGSLTSTGWVNIAPNITIPVSDTASGVQSNTIRLTPNGPTDTKTNKKADNVTICDAASGCATSLSHSWSPNVADGRYTLSATAADPVGHTRDLPASSVKIDRTFPSATPSGSLYQPSAWITDSAKALHVDATDATSGVKTVYLRVDNTIIDTKTATCSPNCPTSFPADFTWTPPSSMTEGPWHSVNVQVVDDAGNTLIYPSWSVRIDKTPPSCICANGTLYKPTAWVVDPNPSISMTFSDNGSGVAKDTLQIDSPPSGPSSVKTNKKSDGVTDCDAVSGCATSMSHPWTPAISDGIHQMSYTTLDGSGRQISDSWQVKVDRGDPGIGAPSGTLYDVRGKWVPAAATRSVTAAATDATSGVRKLELIVDDGARDTNTATCAPTCPTSFSGTLSWDSSGWSNGAHTVSVRATDDAGRTKDTASWTVYTDSRAPLWDPDGGSMAAAGWQNAADPSLTVNTTDTGGSGVARSTIQFDAPNGPTFVKNGQKADGSACDDTPGCPTSMPHTVTPTLSDGIHSATITALDAVGQSRSRTLGMILIDRVAPALQSASGSLYAPGGWFGDGTKTMHVVYKDATSATTKIELWVDGVLSSAVTCNSGCGTAPFSADFNWTPPANAANGSHAFVVKAYDSAGNVAQLPWSTGLDRLQPDVPNVSGGGWDGEYAQGALRAGHHDIHVDAHDAHSGVLHVQAFVDDADDTADTPVQVGSVDPSCTTSGCPLNASGDFSWDDSTGPMSNWSHVHVLVRITDQVGNTSEDQRTLGRDGSKPTALITGDLKQPDQVLSGGPYHLAVAAVDGTTQQPSSGVARIELAVDGTTRDSCDQTVAGDSAPLTCNFTFDPQTSDEGERVIAVNVTDRAGNVYNEHWSVIFDHTNPDLASPSHSGLPDGWVENATPTVTLDATDGQSGVKKIDLYTPTGNLFGGDDTQVSDSGCTGTVLDRCPHSASHTFNYGSTLPEGNNRIHAHAEDAASPAHVSTPDREWSLKIDHTPPEVHESGSLTTLGSAPIVAGAYDLQIDATDGTRDDRANERSGVKSIEVLVRKEDQDPPEDFHRVYYDEQDCAEGSCPMSRNWVFRREAYEEGTYTVHVVVKDQMGHPSPVDELHPDLTVRVGPDVLEPRQAMGLEDFWQFETVKTGAGTSANVNLATGNMVWHSTPIVNPGRGLSTVANVDYNSQALTKDAALDYNQIGEGFSLGIAGLTRVNEPLDVSLADINGPIFLTDVDGTRHKFTPSGDAHHWIHPAGFDVYLRRFSPNLMPSSVGDAFDAQHVWAATRPDGVTFYFDAAGYPTFIQDRNGNQIRFDYQYISIAGHHEECDIGASLTVLTSAACRRRLIRVVDPVGVDADPKQFEDNEANEDATLRNQRSVQICYYPDLVEGATQIPGSGRIKRLKDHAGRITSFAYDDDGYLTGMTQAQRPSADESGEGDCKNTDESGQLPASRTFHFDYEAKDAQADPQSLVAKRYMTSVTDPKHESGPSGGSDGKTVFHYEAREHALEDQAETDPQSLTAFQRRRVLQIDDRDSGQTLFGYSEENPVDGPPTFKASVTDPRATSSEYTMDKLARPVDIKEPDGTDGHPRMVETTLGWDDQHFADNKVERLTRAANFPGEGLTTNMLYDQTGQLTDRYLQDNLQKDHYHLDYAYSRGNQIAPNGWDDNTVFVADLTDVSTPRVYAPEGCTQCTTHFIRDDRGNVTGTIDGEGDLSQTHYEAVHHQIDYEIDPVGNRTEYSDYDPSGSPRTVVDPRGTVAGGAPAQHTWKYAYDAVGNVTGVTDPRGTSEGSLPTVRDSAFTTTLGYDQLDRLRTEHIPKLSQSGKYIDHSKDYDVNDNLLSQTDGNHRTTSYSYTPMDRVQEVDSPPAEHGTPGALLPESTVYSYDGNGNVLTVDTPNGTHTPGAPRDSSVRFVYDDANRKIAQARRSHDDTDGEKDLLTTYSYDVRGNMVGLSDPRRNRGFSPSDPPTSYEADVDGWSAPLRFRYVYDDSGRRTDQFEDPSGLNLNRHFDYDANGNVLRDRDPREKETSYHYDAADRLRTTTDPEGDTQERDLRGDGSLARLIKPNGTATEADGDYEVDYTYEPTGEVKTVTLPRAANQYGAPLQVSYPERDGAGNPTEIVDPRGNHIHNTFFDTGDVRTTDRPSWWRYKGEKTGGSIVERQIPGIGVPSKPDEAAIRASGGGTDDGDGGDGGGGAGSGDDGGEAQSAQQDGDDSPDAQPSGDTPADTTPPGNFGEVHPRPLPDLLPRAGHTTFDYDNEMRLTDVGDADWDGETLDHLTRLERDPLGRVTAVSRPFKHDDGTTDAERIVTRQTYDFNGNVTKSVNGRGDATTYDYDQFDRQTKMHAPGSNTSGDQELTTTDYDENGNVVERTLPRGDASYTREYDSVDRPLMDADPLGQTTTYAYDRGGNRIAERSPRGNPLGCHTNGDAPACTPFDDSEPTCTGVDPDNLDMACFTTVNSYDDANRLEQTTEPAGRTTTFDYDRDGNKTTVDAPAARSPDGTLRRQVTEQSFDGRDLLWTKTTGTGDEHRTVVTEYDGNGNLRRAVNPMGVGSDGLPANPDVGLSLQTTDPGDDGDRSDPGLRAATKDATVNEYDADNLLTAKHMPWSDHDADHHSNDEPGDTPSYNADSERWRTDYEYDGLGRAIRMTAPYKWAEGAAAGTANTYAYWDNGWTRRATDASGSNVYYDYEETGNQKSWNVGSEANPSRYVRRDFYPSGTLRERVAHNGDDQLTYDYQYNPDRALTQIDSVRPDRTMKVTRDRADRETRITNSDNDADSSRYFEHDTAFGWDRNDNLEKRFTDGSGDIDSYGGGTRATFKFDAADREVHAHLAKAEHGTRDYDSDWYDSDQRAELRKYSDDVGLRSTVDFFYNDDGRIARKVRHPHTETGNPVTQDYSYNRNGNRTEDDRGTSSFNSRGQVTTWTRKPAGQITQPKPVLYWVRGDGNFDKKEDKDSTSTYDIDGGRVKSSTTVSKQAAPTRYDRYCYGEFGKLEAIHKVVDEGHIDGGCQESFVAKDDTRYDYDPFDRLIRAQSPPSTQTYSYDGLDRREMRCKTTVATGDDAAPGLDLPQNGEDPQCSSSLKTEYDYIGTSKALSSEETDGSSTTAGKTRRFDYDSKGEVLGYEQGGAGGEKYMTYDKDPQGTIMGLEDGSGAISDGDRYSYDPYGELQSKTESTPDPNGGNIPQPFDPNADAEDDPNAGYSTDAKDNPLRFQGFYYDSGVKLYDMQARAYRPQVGRFLTADRFESSDADFELEADPLTQNRYAFAGGNPIDNVEFDGHWWSGGWYRPKPKPKPKPKTKTKTKTTRRAGNEGCGACGGHAARPGRPVASAHVRSRAPVSGNLGKEDSGPGVAETVFNAITGGDNPADPSGLAAKQARDNAKTFASDVAGVPSAIQQSSQCAANPACNASAQNPVNAFKATAQQYAHAGPNAIEGHLLFAALFGRVAGPEAGSAARVVTGSALEDASLASFKAAAGPINISPKHLPGAGGRFNKFAQGVDPEAAVREGLQSPNAIFRPNPDHPGYRVDTDLGRVIGEGGRTTVRTIVSSDGRVITAFPYGPKAP